VKFVERGNSGKLGDDWRILLDQVEAGEDVAAKIMSRFVDQGGVVSFPDILKKLLGGKYDTMTGHPDAASRVREFVREVTSRVPELRGKEEWEVEETVHDAVEWAIRSICKPEKTAEVTTIPDHYEFVGVYSCYHPDIGKFYMTVNEEEDSAAAFGYWGVRITKNKSEALSDYKDVVSYWREREVEVEEW